MSVTALAAILAREPRKLMRRRNAQIGRHWRNYHFDPNVWRLPDSCPGLTYRFCEFSLICRLVFCLNMAIMNIWGNRGPLTSTSWRSRPDSIAQCHE